MNLRTTIFPLLWLALAASAPAQTSNKAVMVNGDQQVLNKKTFEQVVVSASGSLITQPGAPIRIGNVALQWNGIGATVCIEADGNNHGLMVHSSGTQGNAIMAFSQSGAPAIKVWQETYATSPALIIGRSGIDAAPGLGPLLRGMQPASLAVSLLKFTGSGTFEVLHTGAPILGGAPPATATSPGTPGQIAWDASFFYVCTGVNEWKRAALSSW